MLQPHIETTEGDDGGIAVNVSLKVDQALRIKVLFWWAASVSA
jgi:hypothetical protein